MIIKRETFNFGGYSFRFKLIAEKEKRYLNVETYKKRRLIDWMEVPVEDNREDI